MEELDAWMKRAVALYQLAEMDPDTERAEVYWSAASKTSERVVEMLHALAGGEDGRVDVGGGE